MWLNLNVVVQALKTFHVKLRDLVEALHKEKSRVVYNNCSPTIRTVEKWFAEFKNGRSSLEDDSCEGNHSQNTGYGFGKSSIN